MRLKCDFEVMEFDSQKVAVPVGEYAKEFHGVVKLNETGVFILEQLKNDTTEEAIINALQAEYEAPRDLLEKDVKEYIENFTKMGLLQQ